VLDVLIEAGADVNRQGKGTRTPLMWASMRFGSADVINKLVDAGADPNRGDSAGQTPLLFSVLHGSPNQTKALIARDADVNQVMLPKWKSPVLNVAVRYKRTEAVECSLPPEPIRLSRTLAVPRRGSWP
jgi:ankyrin repeat protein